jgi:D-glycerate 3-kinase
MKKLFARALMSPEVEREISERRLPPSFRILLATCYQKLAGWVSRSHRDLQARKQGLPFVVGVSGAQGTGKSTLTAFLKIFLEQIQLKTVVLSIDDFYLDRQRRKLLAHLLHPLFQTRGVPGTHDIAAVIETLRDVKSGQTSKICLPKFNKATDNPFNREDWDSVSLPVDIVLFEGWCVGCRPQSERALEFACNELEAQEDRAGDWRRHVNEALSGSYRECFEMIDGLIYLKAPNMDAVHKWREIQEQTLAAKQAKRESSEDRVMNKAALRRFIQHYERLTRHMFVDLEGVADIVCLFNEGHEMVRCSLD